MPVHDWTRVDGGIFHDFHNAWVLEIRNVLNGGLLPEGFYALTEQHAGQYILDLLTLHETSPDKEGSLPTVSGGKAVLESPPKVSRKLTAAGRTRRRTVAIRHVTGHRLVAMIEIVSPANKDRPSHVEEFAEKIVESLRRGIHVLLVDLFAPGRHDPQGMHGVVWQTYEDEPYDLPVGEPLTLASYIGGRRPEAYLEHFALGSSLSDMPLFLHPEHYVDLPLEPTYQAALRGTPTIWRDVLEGG